MGGTNDEGSEESYSGEYSLIPVVKTPKINPGETIILDYYVTGRHPDNDPPENVRLNVNINGLSVKSGEVIEYVDQSWEDQGETLQFVKGEKVDTKDIPANQSTFSLKIPEALFFPNPEMIDGSDPYNSPHLHGELETSSEGDPPYKLKLKTSDSQNPGEHSITSTLVYQQDGDAKTEKVINQIHLNTWYEQHQYIINTVIILLTLIGVLFPIFEFIFLTCQF